ncbi:ABC transporter ATP-binding protein [Aquisalimonas asiatica]|uniref:Iron(III) transport system ATP-binding protein n=1 Tax=Aquisalimonas asiatica TaxID=406100 RepID=A0A1H8RS08_9GAMM|nr:ABC transporter ATP-binding protein [Aquisalimonas asiatica]SEO69067.1 iron(III) transport system ATP-binding protein [Aquisalimonas asiatica]
MATFMQCKGLTKEFAGRRVLDGIDLKVNQGECVVLLGPSGCGKSTLLNVITGMLAADSGTLACRGRTLDDPANGIHVAMRERGFSMVFQDFSLWPHMTVSENVAFGLRMQRVNAPHRARRVQEVLDQVQMGAFRNRRPDQLSGGQQQRVAIARALAVQPDLMLLDEPLSALDARLREDLKHELARLLRETGLTAVYVTHDQAEAFTLGDQVAVMNRGRIEQCGTPEVIYNEPRTQFVAEFLGASNLMPYRRNGSSIVIDDGVLDLPGNGALPAESGQCLVRREAICISSERCCSGDDLVELPATCEQTNFLGDRHEAFATLPNGRLIRGFADGAVNRGGAVHVRFPASAMRFLSD